MRKSDMSFEWLEKFRQHMPKDANYAEKTLAAYALGMKAKGSIIGVRVEPGAECCDMARHLPRKIVYRPEEAPRVPLSSCDRPDTCGCVYQPVMSFEQKDS